MLNEQIPEAVFTGSVEAMFAMRSVTETKVITATNLQARSATAT
ncbi:MAG: hypothetical protein WD029_03285 [Microthrixaceae bacterium]